MADRPVVVLASGSPRRLELLHRLGVDALVCPVDVDESPMAGEAAVAYVRRLALSKATAAGAGWGDGALVIGADTTVVLDGALLGKPADATEARAMLHLLSGRTHEVHTGVCVVAGHRHGVGVETTAVRFRALDPTEIDRYVDSGEPLDKAGAYGIQGAAGAFVESITGSDSNVVGLPLSLVVRLARDLGTDLLLPP